MVRILIILILIFVLILIIKSFVINRFRDKRDNIDFTTFEGVKEIRSINKKIDWLNGFF